MHVGKLAEQKEGGSSGRTYSFPRIRGRGKEGVKLPVEGIFSGGEGG